LDDDMLMKTFLPFSH